MCGCDLVIDSLLNEPIVMDSRKRSFTYSDDRVHVLLQDFIIEGKIDYSALHKIENMYGVNKGYIFVIGDRQQETNGTNNF